MPVPGWWSDKTCAPDSSGLFRVKRREQELLGLIEGYRQGLLPLIVPVT